MKGPWIRPDGMESWTTISDVAERNPGYQYVPRQGSEAVSGIPGGKHWHRNHRCFTVHSFLYVHPSGYYCLRWLSPSEAWQLKLGNWSWFHMVTQPSRTPRMHGNMFYIYICIDIYVTTLCICLYIYTHIVYVCVIYIYIYWCHSNISHINMCYFGFTIFFVQQNVFFCETKLRMLREYFDCISQTMNNTAEL